MTDRQFGQPVDQRWPQPHTPFWRRMLWVAAILAAVLLLIWFIRPSANSQKSGRYGAGGPVPIGVAQVASGDVRVMLDGLGAVTPLATVTVHPQVTGYLNRFDMTEGQMVRSGQVLAEIDPRPFQAALDQARGQLARDAATLSKDTTDLGRYEALWKQNSVSQQIYQDQVGTVATDKGTVAADKAAVEAAAINLAFCRVTSPVAGRVGLRQVDPGNLVVSGGTTALVVVTQLQPISVIFSIPEDSINRLMRHFGAGEKLEATAFDRSMTTLLATGTLSNVDNEIDPTTGMVKLRAMFDNSDNALFPSQFVNIRLLMATLHDQTYAPSAAIQHGAQGTYVYVIDRSQPKNPVANMRTIRTGPTDGDRVAIMDGLSPGEMVVIDGADRLKDGASVLLPGSRPPPPGTAGSAGQDGGAGGHGQWKGRHGHHHHHPAGDQGGSGQGGSP